MPSSGRFTQKLSVGATVVSLPTETAEGRPYVRAFMTIETAAIRFLYDGTTPTDDYGHLGSSGNQVAVDTPENIRNFRMIADTGTSATVTVTLETL